MLTWKTAFSDLILTFRKSDLWIYLGQIEVKQKYRRSLLGPWWITISMMIFIMAMGIVFSRLFKQDLRHYLPNFTTGFLFWTFFSTSLTEATETLKSNSGFIKQIHLPHLVYIFKHLTKHTIILLHNFAVYILICLYFQINPGLKILLFIPGFFLFNANLFWITLLVAMICARFRDMVPIITSCLQIAFFVTPISWSANLLSPESKIVLLNPLSYMFDIVKAPLLGNFPMAASWITLSTGAILGIFITISLYSRKKTLIPFWIN